MVISGHYTFGEGHLLSHVGLQLSRVKAPFLSLPLQLFFALSFMNDKSSGEGFMERELPLTIEMYPK